MVAPREHEYDADVIYERVNELQEIVKDERTEIKGLDRARRDEIGALLQSVVERPCE